jgi:putative DNA primase/helicase
LRPHSPRDFLTRSTEVPYEPDLPISPLWERFLARVLPDPETRAFVQRAVGASLTGKPIEERFLFLHGPAATGKSTFLSALRGALGGYYQTASFETFLKGSGSGPRQDLAVLQGARIVIASEADDDRRFASGLLKSITGGEQITARYLYGREFSFVPSFTLWLASNSRPAINAEDSGLWRRIVEIPFVHSIPESERDPQLKKSLIETRVCQETVLKWAIEGCLAWQLGGLRPPQAVRDAVTEYHASCDDLGSFLSECYRRSSEEHMLLMKEVHDRYVAWCEGEGLKPVSNRRFRKALGDRGWATKDVAQGVAVCGIKEAK